MSAFFMTNDDKGFVIPKIVVEVEVRDRTIEYKVHHSDHRDGYRLSSTLSCFDGEVNYGLRGPKQFGLYVWDAPYHDWRLRDATWVACVEAITGLKVKNALEYSGNGHGYLTVQYEEEL